MMSDVELREMFACRRVDKVPIPSKPSFNCESQQCGARVWGPYNSPIKPIRVWRAVQRYMTKSNKPHWDTGTSGAP
jgi:hypothetical protein